MDHGTINATRVEHKKKPATLLGREPVMYLGLIQSALAMGIGFGLDLSTEQTGLIMAFSAAVLGFIARQAVTPIEKEQDLPAKG